MGNQADIDDNKEYTFVGNGDFKFRVVENISLTYSHEDIEVEGVFKFDNNAGV